MQLFHAKGLVPPSGYKTLDPYLKVTFPFPAEEPQVFVTPKLSKTLDPGIWRSVALARACTCSNRTHMCRRQNSASRPSSTLTERSAP